MHQAPLPVPLATVVVDLATAPVPTTTPRAVPLATVVVDLATAPVPTTTPRAVPLATVVVDLATVPTTTPRAAIPVPLTVPRTAPRTGPRHAHWYCPHQQATLATGDEFFVRDGRLPTPVTVVAVAVPTREPAMTVAVATKAVISLRIFPPCSARLIYSTRDRIGCSWRRLRPAPPAMRLVADALGRGRAIDAITKLEPWRLPGGVWYWRHGGADQRGRSDTLCRTLFQSLLFSACSWPFWRSGWDSNPAQASP